MMHAALPYHLYVNVDNRALGLPGGLTRALWHGIYSRPGQVILAHCMLETGAHWTGVPLHAITTSNRRPRLSAQATQPWGAMGERLTVVALPYLEGLRCAPTQPKRHGNVRAARHTGMVIDWADGYSRYPAEHKPLQLIHADNGQFLALPNNFLTFEDAHFVESANPLPQYRRGSRVYWLD